MRVLLCAVALVAGLAGAPARAGQISEASVEYALWWGLWQYMAGKDGTPFPDASVQAASENAPADAAPAGALPAGAAPPPTDLAHAFATARITDAEDAVGIERILDVAVFWLEWDRAGTIPKALVAASFTGEQARAMLCYVSGEGPGPADDLITKWGLPSANPDTCDFDLAERMDLAEASLTDKRSGQGVLHVDVTAAPEPWARWIKRSGVLASVAAQANGLPGVTGLSLRAAPCGQAGIVVNRDDKRLILCTEMLDAMNKAAGED